MTRHTRFGINPIAHHDLPPPLPQLVFPPATAPPVEGVPHVNDDDVISKISSRAGSVQPSEPDHEPAKRKKIDRFGRQISDRTNSPNPQQSKRVRHGGKQGRDLPKEIIDFLGALPPAEMFDGATFHVDELVRLIRDVGVPLPSGFVRKRGRE